MPKLWSVPLTRVNFRLTVPPLDRFNSVTSTRSPGVSPSAVAMAPAFAAGGGADVVGGAGAGAGVCWTVAILTVVVDAAVVVCVVSSFLPQAARAMREHNAGTSATRNETI